MRSDSSATVAVVAQSRDPHHHVPLLLLRQHRQCHHRTRSSRHDHSSERDLAPTRPSTSLQLPFALGRSQCAHDRPFQHRLGAARKHFRPTASAHPLDAVVCLHEHVVRARQVVLEPARGSSLAGLWVRAR